TQGAGDDLAKATGIVKRMVAQYGMFGLFGPAAIMRKPPITWEIPMGAACCRGWSRRCPGR
ncbi:hypothetical protein, partial [Enterocloster asparagiformis]|uniref:hypothetical protein n=1 Tax=Enterocloster asparagiformis TaxID=333367 RepID=UPI00054E344E